MASIGGEFPLDALTLAAAQDGKAWRGLPGWQTGARYTSSGRTAMLWSLRALGAKPGPIWVPEYLCYCLLDSLRKDGWTPRPYPLKDDLTVDLDAWSRQPDAGRGACLVLHFFGFAQPQAVWDFLAEREAFPVLEDRAHSLLNEQEDRGDASFASLRKWLALPDGGVARVRKPRKKPSLAAPDPVFLRRRVLALSARHEFLAESSSGGETREPYFLGMIDAAEKRLDDDEAVRDLSPVSRELLRTTDFKALAARRRANYKRLAAALKGHPNVELLFPELPAGVVPLGCPAACADRDGLRAKLKGENIFCAVHWPASHWPAGWATPHAGRLGARLMTLPVDQRLSAVDVDRLAERIWKHGAKK